MKNMMKEKIEILSILADSYNFHPGPLDKHEIGPNEILEIEILYLPRLLGYVEESLVIQTSVGSFLYQVSSSFSLPLAFFYFLLFSKRELIFYLFFFLGNFFLNYFVR